MQNVTLPDKGEVEAACPQGDPLWPTVTSALADWAGPTKTLGILRAEVSYLKAWVRALYAKHGEVCPLSGGEEDTMDKTRMLPVCPDCGEEMVKARHENEEGDWSYYWLCACKVEEVPE
uniref:Uncharacterized protein n=1 Tax=viral metagenome TaxID=1070528 RepID=A0A6M3XV89_9ZZZZ